MLSLKKLSEKTPRCGTRAVSTPERWNEGFPPHQAFGLGIGEVISDAALSIGIGAVGISNKAEPPAARFASRPGSLN